MFAAQKHVTVAAPPATVALGDLISNGRAYGCIRRLLVHLAVMCLLIFLNTLDLEILRTRICQYDHDYGSNHKNTENQHGKCFDNELAKSGRFA